MLRFSLMHPLILIAALSTLAACGAKDEDEEDAKGPLEGTWSVTCGTDDATVEAPDYDKMTRTFSSNTVASIYEGFSDAACATATFSLRFESTFTIGDAVTTPTGATSADFTPTKRFVTVSNADFLAAFNGTAEGSTATCGGGFVLNTEKELTEALCKNDSIFKFEVVYSIFKIDGAKLYQGKIGDTGTATDGSAATKRPTEFEPRPMTKL